MAEETGPDRTSGSDGAVRGTGGAAAETALNETVVNETVPNEAAHAAGTADGAAADAPGTDAAPAPNAAATASASAGGPGADGAAAGSGARTGSDDARTGPDAETDAGAESGSGSETGPGAENGSGSEAGSGAEPADGEGTDADAVRPARSRRFPRLTRDTARPEGGGRAASGGAPAPARQWPLIAVIGGTAVGLLVVATDAGRAGTLIIGLSLIAAAVLRRVLPSVGMLAVRSKFTDMATYGGLGLVIVLLAMMIQPNPWLDIPWLEDVAHFSVE
ncbi:DUF3017 domain-containing protein [Streptomyces sp. bgisy100]|uniref:DUF3017 domain-containing protein n=1 Tax=Streptomyces sp. bgisy100 TaxID=3413783 RepID=UPI003D75E8C2